MNKDNLENESVRGNSNPILPVENTDKSDVPVPSNRFPIPLGDGGWPSWCRVKGKFELRNRPDGIDNPWGWVALVSALPRLLPCITYELQRLGFLGLSIWCYLQTGNIFACALLLAVGFLTQPLAERAMTKAGLLGGYKSVPENRTEIDDSKVKVVPSVPCDGYTKETIQINPQTDLPSDR